MFYRKAGLYYNNYYHTYDKILKFDWLLACPIWVFIGQFTHHAWRFRTVYPSCLVFLDGGSLLRLLLSDSVTLMFLLQGFHSIQSVIVLSASPFQAFSQWGSKIACETITSGSRSFTFARPLFPSSPLPGLLTSLGYTPARVKQSHSPVSRSSNFVHHSNDYRPNWTYHN